MPRQKCALLAILLALLQRIFMYCCVLFVVVICAVAVVVASHRWMSWSRSIALHWLSYIVLLSRVDFAVCLYRLQTVDEIERETERSMVEMGDAVGSFDTQSFAVKQQQREQNKAAAIKNAFAQVRPRMCVRRGCQQSPFVACGVGEFFRCIVRLAALCTFPLRFWE